MGEDPLITHQIVIPGWTAGGVPALWVSENPPQHTHILQHFHTFWKEFKADYFSF